ncbi:MAG: hypothetical protein RLN85_21290, partial [Pseudomonadales bacterium]
RAFVFFFLDHIHWITSALACNTASPSGFSPNEFKSGKPKPYVHSVTAKTNSTRYVAAEFNFATRSG